jgi:hypothetical protein
MYQTGTEIYTDKVIDTMGRNPYLNSSRSSLGGRRSRRRHRRNRSWVPYAILGAVFVILLAVAGWFFAKRNSQDASSNSVSTAAPNQSDSSDSSPESESMEGENQEASDPESLEGILSQADLLAAGYDYDAAISLLQESPYASSAEAAAAIDGYNQTKATLVRTDPRKITHVFFHTLIMDNSKAFDGDTREKGYNQVMTTKDEFMKILQSMYDRGFVLVRLHDIAYEVTGENGTPQFKEGDIMLPPGKQAFVMSQDDVCYYEYMEGDGFASRMIIGEDGRPTCEMNMDDGSVSVGSYDLVPLLDDFIEEHPDFSYRGARAVIAFTGYNGILGYRTAPSYNTEEYKAEHPDFDYDQEREQAAKVAQCLKDSGYELASHSWGHRNMGTISMENFIADTDKWENEVEPLTGPCDIILFPFGSDIADWHPYDTSSERYQYLHGKGFRYFCNVDSSQYFVQIGDDYMRQGRRNLDGYRMYYDLPESGVGNDHLSDLFDVNEVFDRSRPTPVPKMSE